MDPAIITALIGFAGTVTAAIGSGVWYAACWFARKADVLIDNHVELTKKLSSEIEWKHTKLEAVHDDIKEIHQVIVPALPERPTKTVKTKPNPA